MRGNNVGFIFLLMNIILQALILYKNDKDLLVFGYNGFGQLGLGDNKDRNKPELLFNDKNIKKIICGNNHTMIYKNNGDLLVFGRNLGGDLGLGDNKKLK